MNILKSKLAFIIVSLVTVATVAAVIVVPGLLENDTLQSSNPTNGQSEPFSNALSTTANTNSGLAGNENFVVNVTIGDTYVFGTYEQDHNFDNGRDPIEWIVLDIQGSRILVVSKYALDCQMYNRELKDVTWETCDMRKWVNDPFFRTAFSEDEAKKIPTVTVTTEGSNPTSDKLFLLSAAEADKYFSLDDEKKCAPSVWTIKVGVTKNSNGCCGWWLRTSGQTRSNAAFVDAYGTTNFNGISVNSYSHGIRPAMWIDLAA